MKNIVIKRAVKTIGATIGGLIFSLNLHAAELEKDVNTTSSLQKVPPIGLIPAGEKHSAGVMPREGIRLLVRSYETAAISAEVNARILVIPTREGDRFEKGDILIKFDCSKIIAEHEAAIAANNGHRIAYENQQKLFKYQAAGALAVEQAKFEMTKSRADVSGMEVRRKACEIRAPFSGRVTEKIANAHEVAQPNQALIRIVNDTKQELVMMAPSAWSSKFTPGMRFSVKVDETGQIHKARIVQTTGHIDPISQSTRIIAELETTTTSVLPGMSGTAILPTQEVTR